MVDGAAPLVAAAKCPARCSSISQQTVTLPGGSEAARLRPISPHPTMATRNPILWVKTHCNARTARTCLSQATEIGLRRLPNGSALVEQPESGGVPIDSEFAPARLVPLWTAYEDILKQRVQEFMHTGVDR